VAAQQFAVRKDVTHGVKNIPAKFHRDPFWYDGALGFLKRSPQQEQQ